MSHVCSRSATIVHRADALAAAFECSWTGGDWDVACLRLAGELDLATAPQLEQSLRARELQAQLVALDLSDLTFMDIAGVRAIVNATIQARRLGRRLILMHCPANVDRLIRLTGSADHVEICGIDQLEPRAQAVIAASARLTDRGRAPRDAAS